MKVKTRTYHINMSMAFDVTIPEDADIDYILENNVGYLIGNSNCEIDDLLIWDTKIEELPKV